MYLTIDMKSEQWRLALDILVLLLEMDEWLGLNTVFSLDHVDGIEEAIVTHVRLCLERSGKKLRAYVFSETENIKKFQKN
jgi:hypothetical protein